MRATIVGHALRTPLGERFFDRLLAKEDAVRAIDRFDASTYAVRLGCAIPPPDPKPSRELRALRRIGRHGFDVACEAIERASLASLDDVGVFCGVGGLRASWDEMLDAFDGQRPDGKDAWNAGLRTLHPFWMLHHLSNNAHALVAQRLGATGGGATYGGANGGAQALVGAIRALHSRAVDHALVFAYDSLLDPETLVELGARGAACTTDTYFPPYHDKACGFVPGEAAAAVVLRRPDVGPTIQAVTGADGQPAEPGLALLSRLIAKLPPADLVDGVGLANVEFDRGERDLHPAGARLTCTQAATGQVGAAAALVQVIAAAHTVERGRAQEVLCLSAGAPGLAAAVHVRGR